MKSYRLPAVFLLAVAFWLIPNLGFGEEQLVLIRELGTSLPVGTHRPDIRTASDGSLVGTVVQPE